MLMNLRRNNFFSRIYRNILCWRNNGRLIYQYLRKQHKKSKGNAAKKHFPMPKWEEVIGKESGNGTRKVKGNDNFPFSPPPTYEKLSEIIENKEEV